MKRKKLTDIFNLIHVKSLPLYLGLIIGLLTLSLIKTIIQAQPLSGAHSLEISPPKQEIAANPGETIKLTAKVRNASQTVLPISVRTENFVASGDEGQVALTEAGPWAVSTWTSISPNKFSLNAGESKEVTATIRIPASGAAGGKYGAFVFSLSGGKSEGSGAQVAQELASLFLIRINGPVDETMNITSFAAPKFSEFGPIPFVISFENKGNVHLKPVTSITIKNLFGRVVSYVQVNPTNVFPGASRKISAEWSKRFLIGYFTATLNAIPDPNNAGTLTSATNFIVFPIRLALIALLIIVFLFLLRKRIGKAIKVLIND
jgi:hypothetical protein